MQQALEQHTAAYSFLLDASVSVCVSERKLCVPLLSCEAVRACSCDCAYVCLIFSRPGLAMAIGLTCAIADVLPLQHAVFLLRCQSRRGLQ